MNANIQLIITSAGIAALVSGGLNFVSNWLERKERRKELLFKTAIDMAKLRIDRLLELADRQKAHVSLRDDLNLAGDYRQMLEHFYEKGKLPLEVIEAEKRSETELKKKKEALIERSKKENVEVAFQRALTDPIMARSFLQNANECGLTPGQIQLLQAVATDALS